MFYHFRQVSPLGASERPKAARQTDEILTIQLTR